MIAQERFVDAPDMVQSLISILRNVISHEMTSIDARKQLQTLLSKAKHNDLLQYILQFLPDSMNERELCGDEAIEAEEEAPPSEDLYSDSSYMHHPFSNNQSDTTDLGKEKQEVAQSVSRGKSSTQPRRQRVSQSHRYRRFSDQEKEQIMDGVKRFGMGSRNLWRRIVSSYKFDRRSAVDIKDAFRTMQRAAWKKKKVVMDQRTPSRRSGLDFTPFTTTGPNMAGADAS